MKKENSVFKDIDKIITKEFDNLIDLSKEDTKVKQWFDTGVYALNYICSKNLFGGIPVGRVTSVDGLESTGKSLLLASLMKDPNVDYILIIETEGGGSSKELYEFAGVDTSKIRMLKASTFENYRVNKKNSNIEEVSDNKFPKKKDTDDYIYVEGVTRIIKKFINIIEFNKVQKNILILLDTLGNLQSVREMSGTPDMGAKSKAIATFFRSFDVAFERTNIAFVFANKLYTNIGNQWQPYVVSGGVNVTYNPSLSIRLTTTAETDDVSDADMKKEKERRKTALGSSLKTIKATIVKSRFGTEQRSIRFLIDFSIGPAKFSGLFGLCRDFGIIDRKGSTYMMDGVFDKAFYKKDFISMIKQDEKNILLKIQKRLEQRENEILHKKHEIQSGEALSEVEDELSDDETLDEGDYDDMKKQMIRDVEKN